MGNFLFQRTRECIKITSYRIRIHGILWCEHYKRPSGVDNKQLVAVPAETYPVGQDESVNLIKNSK